MIVAIIRWSIFNRGLVVLGALLVAVLGLVTLKDLPIDAIPDLSDVQVIVKTAYPGQAPEVVQDQITYPLTTALMSVPGATVVRGYSFFGDSYVYVLFDEETDLYWARSRVQESLSQAAARLPTGATPQLGPDATGVGWVYLYALIDRTGQHNLSELRDLQDWFLKFELQSLPGVSEVATVGGMVKQYQVVVSPEKLQAYGMPLSHIETAIKRSNQEIGAEAEYMVRVTGYIASIEDLENIALGVNDQGTPQRLKDVASVRLGPGPRRAVTDWNGEGEAVGGIVVMRAGENALATIAGVKTRLAALKQGLPEGVDVVTVYDRSDLIDRAIANLSETLVEELIIVALVCLAFLVHLRSSLVAVISLPLGIVIALLILKAQGLNANIMSLGGIAIAVGAMIDGAIVMIENLNKHLEDQAPSTEDHWSIVTKAASEVGPALFFSLLIITVSFVPVFTLGAEEGKLFGPLAYTKTYAMAAAAALTVTLVPVLMGYFVRGRIRREQDNPINRWMAAGYMPLLKTALRFPIPVLLGAVLLLGSILVPLQHIGSEFMPPLDEGDLMYMPTTFPGISIGKARALLQQSHKLIREVPEVVSVYGKAGRAETATDPAPLTMIESFIRLKPKDQWREGLTLTALKKELDERVQFPGVSNAWVMPIKTRIDMLSTGVKTPIGIKISGPELSVIQSLGAELESLLAGLAGTTSVYAERVLSGRYLMIDIDRVKAARYGLNIADIHAIVGSAVGGAVVAETVEGQARYPISLRYPQSSRDSPEHLRALPLVLGNGNQIVLSDVANIRITDGPAGIKSENGRISGWTYVEADGVDLGAYVASAQALLDEALVLPPGYAVSWSGQYESLERSKAQLEVMVPVTLLLIAFLIYLNFRSVMAVLILMATLPLSLVGSLWLIFWLGFDFSVAVGVGLIALAGVAAELGVIMLVYLNQALARGLASKVSDQVSLSRADLKQVVLTGAVRRVRPVVMTTCATIAGLLPILWSTGTGSEVMQRLAAPMVGGMLSALLLSLFVLPVVFYLWKGKALALSK
ncbi:CusA/CzcA family heavy metal efflux RND transporter [Pseudomonadales bacterium]|nr:CusA/CzcA family heavy metal efflux RND transporter [Pseudomonadales bacterium]